MAKFQSGHGGRPKGTRDTRARLTGQMFEDMLAHWNEPVKPDSSRRKGPAALEVCFKQSPDAYLRLVASVLPKEFIFESVTSDLNDEQIDELIAALRQRITETRTAPTMLVDGNGIGDEPAKPRH
jgi:hypothetical protein